MSHAAGRHSVKEAEGRVVAAIEAQLRRLPNHNKCDGRDTVAFLVVLDVNIVTHATSDTECTASLTCPLLIKGAAWK